MSSSSNKCSVETIAVKLSKNNRVLIVILNDDFGSPEFIFWGLCLVLCESCQYIPSSEFKDSLEIRSCDHTIFPLSDRMAKNLNRLLVVDNNFSFNFRINAFLNLVQKLQYLEFRDNSLIVFSKSKFEKLSNLVELRIKEKKIRFVVVLFATE